MNRLKHEHGILLIGVIEILIGGFTLLATFISWNLAVMTETPYIKSLNVFIFILITASTSSLLGMGLLNHQKTAYQLLRYFSSVIILSKVLIFARIIHLNGVLETSIPSGVKNTISILYHISILIYLSRPSVRKIFIPDQVQSLG